MLKLLWRDLRDKALYFRAVLFANSSLSHTTLWRFVIFVSTALPANDLELPIGRRDFLRGSMRIADTSLPGVTISMKTQVVAIDSLLPIFHLCEYRTVEPKGTISYVLPGIF